ncbi:CDP-glycerol glycerophosphotransferase family protein [Marine Group III euryarchaeote]|nr:CDP-glycerol glycerophosphotransferase family protein [Marine Group III euryarchaeote]
MIKSTGMAVRDWLFNRCVAIRSISKDEDKKIIVGFVAGTKTGIAGSSKVLFEAMKDDSQFFPYWIYQDIKGKRNFNNDINAYYRRSFHKIGLFLKTNIWITTHGDFGVPIDYKRYKQKRMELWHGIPFKGFLKENRERISEDFNKASTVVITSRFFKNMFSKEWSVKEGILKDLGQPRTDALINKNLSKENLKEKLNIKQKKVILYAPTHQQDDDKKKELFPWKSDETFEKLLEHMEDDIALIIRPHPYWKESISKFIKNKINNDKRIYYLPAAKVNSAEDLIYISDILMTDWSSIYFDFLLMGKPTIFIDSPNPFKDNFLMKPEERIGYLCSSSNELALNIYETINDTEKYHTKYDEKLNLLKTKIYSNLDGKSTERCLKDIVRLVK